MKMGTNTNVTYASNSSIISNNNISTGSITVKTDLQINIDRAYILGTRLYEIQESLDTILERLSPSNNVLREENPTKSETFDPQGDLAILADRLNYVAVKISRVEDALVALNKLI